MDSATTDLQAIKQRRHRRLALPVLALLACTLLWQGFEFFLQVDRYRPLVVARIGAQTGLNVSMAPLHISLLPTPCLRTQKVTLGQDDFRLAAQDVKVYLSLTGLLRKRLHIRLVDVASVALTLPEDHAQLDEKLTTLRANIASGTSSSSPNRASIKMFRVRTGSLFRGAGTTPQATFTLQAKDVLSHTPSIDMRAKLTAYGPAQAKGHIEFLRGQRGEPPSLKGQVSIANLAMQSLTGTPPFSAMRISMAADIKGESPQNIVLAITGEIKSNNGSSLGLLKGSAEYNHKRIAVSGLAWNGPGIDVLADIVRTPQGETTCLFSHIRLTQPGLAKLTSGALGRYQLGPGTDASLVATNLTLVTAPKTLPSMTGGSIAFTDLDILDHSGRKIAEGVQGKAAIHDRTLVVSKLAGRGFDLSGEVQLAPQTGTFAIRGTGKISLDTSLLHILGAPAMLQETSGTLALHHFSGTFSKTTSIPNDLAINGTINEGALSLVHGNFKDRIQNANITFALAINPPDKEIVLSLAGKADSKRCGPLTADLQYSISTGEGKGQVAVDCTHIADSFAAGAQWREQAQPLLDAFTPSILHFDIAARSDGMSLSFKRQGLPNIQGQIDLLRDAPRAALTPGTARATAQIPAALLTPFVSEAIQAQGLAELSLLCAPPQDGGIQKFTLELNMTPCNLDYPNRLRKPQGIELVASMDGRKTSSKWTPSSITLQCNGERIEWTLDGKTPHENNVNIQAASLEPLLPSYKQLEGRIVGSVGLQPLTCDLTFEDLRAEAFQQEWTIQALEGRVVYSDAGQMQFHDLHIACADSDLNVSLDVTQNKMSGTLSGKRLNLDKLPAVQALFARETKKGKSQDTPRTIELQTAVDTVVYRGFPFTQVAAEVNVNQKTTRVRHLTAHAGQGTLEASVDVAPAYVLAEIRLDSVDLAAIDKLLFSDEPRGLLGTVSGPIKFKCPLGKGEATLSETDCQADLVMQQGTLGKMGIATHLLSALDTANILKLRRPSLADRGLAFETCSANIAMEQGNMTVNSFSLASANYAMESVGTIDFHDQQTHLLIQVYVLTGLGDLVKHVPLVGSVAEKFKQITPVNVVVVGPPDKPRIHVDVMRNIKGVGEQINKAAKSGKHIVVKGLIGGAAKKLGGIIGRD